jgi:ferredoxin
MGRTIDLTPAEAARQTFSANPQGLTIIGAPVYAGRVPADMVVRLRNITGGGGPAVVLVVYGNRAYEDALLELRDLALGAGFQPIAAGAFIGEHSYSQDATPIALGRPDGADMPPLSVPGTFPYKDSGLTSGVAPVTDAAQCDRCGECVSLCPGGAIAAEDPSHADAEKCIRCCACVKFCPLGAKAMDHPRIQQFREYLTKNHSAPKQPETYL